MRILFVCSRPPQPVRKGDQARVSGWVRTLGGKHQLRIIAPEAPLVSDDHQRSGSSEAALPPFSVWHRVFACHRAVSLPIQVALCIHRSLEAEVRRTISSWKPDVVVLVLSRMGWLMPVLESVPVVVDFVDSLALNMSMRAQRQATFRWFWKWEESRIQRWEQSLLAQVEAGVVVSQRDRRHLLKGCRSTDTLEVLPFGMDLPDRPERVKTEFPILVTSGNLGYYPTVDGVRWFSRYVWPTLKTRCPGLRWWLAGSRPAASIKRLAKAERIDLHLSPQSIGDLLCQASVAVVPLFSGSGVPIKILEAMAHGVPVVATQHAFEGLDELREGAIGHTDEPTHFADLVIELLEDPGAAMAQARLASAWLDERHSLVAVARRFESILRTVADRRTSDG